MIPKSVQRFSEKIILKQARPRSGSTTGGRAWRRVPAFRTAPACFLPATAIHGSFERSALMSAAATTTNTIRLHRVLRAAPERIYRAFLDADAMVKWLPPNGFTAKVLQMDARVGGSLTLL